MKTTDKVAPSVERMAREILKSGGRDPDMPVQAGEPEVYGTPNGTAFAVAPGAEVPLWRMYISSATKLLDAALTILEDKVDEEDAADGAVKAAE